MGLTNTRKILLTNATIYTPDEIIYEGSLLIEAGKITGIFHKDTINETVVSQASEVMDMQGDLLLPGFIDVHVHGGGGFEVMAAADESRSLEGMSLFHASHGTTSFLATTLTYDHDTITRTLAALAEQISSGTTGAEPLGIHLEGPFLNPVRCGAQNPAHMRLARIEEMTDYLKIARNNVKLMTIAPEREGAMPVIQYARSKGVTISIGHSDANYSVMEEAVRQGASHVTHLFNGMSPLHHREPGVAGSALMLDALAVELICDGIHMTKEVARYVFHTKPQDRIVLITDAIRAAGCPDGNYSLGGLPIVVKGGKATLESNGSLAGSCLTMDQALRNVLAWTDKSLFEILPTLTINPARQIGVDAFKGSIAIGKDADLVRMDADYRVKGTYVKGRKVSTSA